MSEIVCHGNGSHAVESEHRMCDVNSLIPVPFYIVIIITIPPTQGNS